MGNPITGPTEERKILEEVEKLVKLGAVREVQHEPYLIPVFGILKKSGNTRLVLDFRKYNSCVTHQPFLPVNREFSLAAIRPYSIGSVLDLYNAYFQVPLHKKIWGTMGIMVCGRFFEYMRLPFGYNNSPHEFLWALWPTMRWIQEHTASQVLFYMDDILLLSQSTEDHYRDLQVVMEGLRRMVGN